ncbi:MAG: PAS domain S-box protein, partial [Flavobacterium sp.]
SISIFYPKEKRNERFPEYEMDQARKYGRFEDEGYRVRKDGTMFWANVVITPLYNQENKLTGYIKITRDLTERKNADEILRLNEAKYRSMINGVKDYAIFFLNPDGTIASWNEGAERIKGYTEKEISGKHFSIFYPKDKQDSKFPEYELKQAKLYGRFEDEGIRVRKDGSTFWANVIITAIYNPDNNKELLGYTKVTRDLTERRDMEQALRTSEQRFRNLIEGVKDYAIYMLNPDGTIASWNEGAKAFKGYSKEEIIGRHFSIFYPKEKIDEGYPQFELEVAKRTGRFEDEGFRIRKDGTKFWANVIITAIYNESRELIGFSKITRDLSERKQTEETLKRSEEKYRLLIDAVKDYAIFIVDLEGRINSWNEGARRLIGYSQNEILGKPISIFYTKDKQEAKYPQYELEQARQFGRFEDEGLRVRKDGSTFFANVIITALYDKNKNICFLIAYSMRSSNSAKLFI